MFLLAKCRTGAYTTVQHSPPGWWDPAVIALNRHCRPASVPLWHQAGPWGTHSHFTRAWRDPCTSSRRRRIQGDGPTPQLESTPEENGHSHRKSPRAITATFSPHSSTPHFAHRARRSWRTLAKGKQTGPGKMVPESHATSSPAC